MTDWITWPIFILELIAFLLLFLKKDAMLFSIRIRIIILGILLFSCLAIVVSLYHDSSSILHLYF